MKCPVCKTLIELPSINSEEFYYDCSVCDSALLFKKGECEILSEGQIKTSSGSPEAENKSLEEKESPTAEAENNALEEKQSPAAEPENKSLEEKESPATEPENNALEEKESPATEPENNALEEESPANEAEGLSAIQDPPSSPETEDSPKEDLEEDFVPDETTEVPELTFPGEISEEEIPENKILEEKIPENLSETEKKESTPSSPLKTEEPLEEDQSDKGEDFPFEEDNLSKKSEPSEEEAGLIEPPSEKEQKEDFAEVAKFGNTQDLDREGPFLYDLILTAINSQNVREKVLSVLEDEHLNLSLQEKPPLIKDGKITIPKISPVKAYVIITSLMGLPLEISWTQHHIADS